MTDETRFNLAQWAFWLTLIATWVAGAWLGWPLLVPMGFIAAIWVSGKIING